METEPAAVASAQTDAKGGGELSGGLNSSEPTPWHKNIMFSMHTNGMPVLKSSATLRQRVQARKKKAKTAEQAGKAPAKTAKTITKRKITKEEKAKAVKGDRPTDLRESRTAGETAIEQQRKACEDRGDAETCNGVVNRPFEVNLLA